MKETTQDSWHTWKMVPSLSLFLVCFEWSTGVLKAKTLIRHCIRLEKAKNIKINEIMH